MIRSIRSPSRIPQFISLEIPETKGKLEVGAGTNAMIIHL